MLKLRHLTLVAALLAALASTGCGTPSSQTVGTVGGAVIGGAVGSAASGGGTLGTLGGAAVGGVIGNEVGKRRDK